MFDPIDWSAIFLVDTPLLEIIVRGSCMYLALFFLLRFVMRRQMGGVGVTDILVIVLIADAAQNAMSDDYRSVPDGILLVSVIIFWDFAFNWMSYHYAWFSKFCDANPVLLIRHGKILHKHLKQELITCDELESQLRLQGVDDIAQVKCAHMEPDGKISVVAYKRARPRTNGHRTRTPGAA